MNKYKGGKREVACMYVVKDLERKKIRQKKE